MNINETFSHLVRKNEGPWITLVVGGCEVHIRFDNNSAPEIVRLEETRRNGISLGGKYSGALDSKHTDDGQQHFHVYARNRELFAINRDGTGHDGNHGMRIPAKVADALRDRFDFKIPTNNVIEWLGQKEHHRLFG